MFTIVFCVEQWASFLLVRNCDCDLSWSDLVCGWWGIQIQELNNLNMCNGPVLIWSMKYISIYCCLACPSVWHLVHRRTGAAYACTQYGVEPSQTSSGNSVASRLILTFPLFRSFPLFCVLVFHFLCLTGVSLPLFADFPRFLCRLVSPLFVQVPPLSG